MTVRVRSRCRDWFRFALLFLIAASVVQDVGEPLWADAPENYSIRNVEIGLDGRFKVGVWSPISFEIAGPEGVEVQPIVVTADPDGQSVRLPLEPATLNGGSALVRGLFCSGRVTAPVIVEVRVGEQVVVSRQFRVDGNLNLRCLAPATRLWAVAADQPPFQALSTRWNELIPGGFEMVSTDAVLAAQSAEDLDSLDGILLTAGTRLSSETAERLRGYVERGGKLVIAIGGQAEQLRSGPLADWLPALPKGSAEVRSLSGINELIPGSATLRMIGSLPAGDLDPAQGTILASGLTFPLILRSAYGIGTVTLIAVALDQRPLSSWDSGPASELAARIADETPPWRLATYGAGRRDDGELSPTGVSDLQTQLLQAVDHFPTVKRSSHQSLLAWLALLVLILGPLDYVLVHRVLQRPELTWLTALVAVVALSVIAVKQADSANAAPLAVAQVDLVDLDAAQGTIRSRSFLSLYSPSAARRRIHFGIDETWQAQEPAAITTLFRGGWAGRPEEGYRGMNRPGGIDFSKPAYWLSSSRDEIENFPTLVWGSSTFHSEWEQHLSADEIASVDLEDGGGNRLTGTFELKLPIELKDWFIAYGDFSYSPRLRNSATVPPLTPGTVWNMRDFGSNLLRGQLVGLSTSSSKGESELKSNITVERINYDPLSRDPATICRILSFHEAAGGTGYSGLTNAAMGRCDLSPLVRLNRAILFGRLTSPTTTMTVDEQTPQQDRRDAFVRVILPVKAILRQRETTPSRDLFEKRK